MTDKKDFLAAFFQRRYAYYTERAEQFEAGKKFTFNPYAFLFGFFWFLYRKLYAEAFIILLLVFAESLIETLILSMFGLENNAAIDFLSGIACGIVIGFCANYLYIRKALKQVAIAQACAGDEEALAYMLKKGGTSVAPLLVILFIFVAVAAWQSQAST